MYQVVGVGHLHAVVNLADKSCSCRKIDLSQIPCMHVAAVARYMGLTNCYQWVHRYYTQSTLCSVYSENVMPLGDQSQWEQPDDLSVRSKFSFLSL